MYGGLVVPADDDGADFGVLFWHKDGFSTACGHGTMALGVWSVETHRVSFPDNGFRDVVIDVPSGRVTARVQLAEGRPVTVGFRNVPSWVHARGAQVSTSRGELACDIAFGGAMYAVVPARSLGLQVTPQHLPDLIAVGREVRNTLNAQSAATHPSDPRLSGIYGTVFVEDVDPEDASATTPFEGLTADGALHQRTVTVFADGQVDRSPCGSGTAARVADLVDAGVLALGRTLVHDSVVGSRFLARAVEDVEADGHRAVVVEVTGTAHRTGSSIFTVDPTDSLVPGFVLR